MNVLVNEMEPLTQFAPNAILGGSHAYGTPRSGEFQTPSDVDLIIYTDEETARKLNELSDHPREPLNVSQRGSFPINFGNLNLIVCIDPEKFELWKRGVTYLKTRAPVSREKACEFFKALFVKYGFMVSEKESQ